MILFTLVLAIAGTNAASQRTIEIATLSGKYLVTYDSARFPEQDVRRWMNLAENGPDYSYLVPEWLELCDKMDSEYQECRTRGWRANNFVHNANVNLRHIRERIKTLDESSYPHELGPVVAYLKTIQETQLFFESQRLLYIQEGQPARLAVSFGGIDARSQCSAEISAVSSAPDRDTAYKIASLKWRNCVNKTLRQKIGPYPETAWKEFLTHHGIRMKFVDDPGED